MAKRIRVAVCVWVVGSFVAWAVPGKAAESPGGSPELSPIPAPRGSVPSLPSQYQPGASYGGLQAGSEAYSRAEQSRRAAIDRQMHVNNQLSYRPWTPYVYGYALPYIHAYAPPRVAQRVQCELDRHLLGGAVGPAPYALGGAYRYPSYSSPQSPDSDRLGANLFRPPYRLLHPTPATRDPASTQAGPQTPTRALRPAPPVPDPQTSAPDRQPDLQKPSDAAPGNSDPSTSLPLASSAPEPIPVPPPEPGPREF